MNNTTDWKELRDKFFLECTDLEEWPNNGRDIKIDMSPEKVFEWFLKNAPKEEPVRAREESSEEAAKSLFFKAYKEAKKGGYSIDEFSYINGAEDALNMAWQASQQHKPSSLPVERVRELLKEQRKLCAKSAHVDRAQEKYYNLHMVDEKSILNAPEPVIEDLAPVSDAVEFAEWIINRRDWREQTENFTLNGNNGRTTEELYKLFKEKDFEPDNKP